MSILQKADKSLDEAVALFGEISYFGREEGTGDSRSL